MKIYVVGTGGVGGYFGGLLAKAGQDVTFVARGEHFEAIKNNGLTIKSVRGDFKIDKAKVTNKISEIVAPDLVLFTVKTYSTEEVAKELKNVVSDKTIIITFQNGIENDLKIKSVINNCKVFPGVAVVISAVTAPGIVSQTGGLCKLMFGDRGNSQNEELKQVEMMMKESNVEATLSDDIGRDLWKKYCFIIPFAGLTALKRWSIGEVMSDLAAKTMYKDCLNETVNVAKALKVNLPTDIFESVMTLTTNTVATAKSSLLVDIENNRQTEIETLHGTLVRLAKENNVDVPINETIYAAIKLLGNKLQ